MKVNGLDEWRRMRERERREETKEEWGKRGSEK